MIHEFKGRIKFGPGEEDEINIPEFTDLEKMNVLVGMNGIGKTLILKTIWFTTYSMFTYRLLGMLAPNNTDELFQKEVIKIFRATFSVEDESFGCNLVIKGESGSPYVFNINITNAELINLEFDIEDPALFAKHMEPAPMFNSKSARTFDRYEQYLKLMKLNGIENIMNHDDALKIADFFPLYDTMWFGHLTQKFKDLAALNQEARTEPKVNIINLLKDGAEDFKSFDSFDARDGIPYMVRTDGSSKKLSSLGAGTQSMLMTTFFSR